MKATIVKDLQRRISGPAALGYVADISRWHRIQASPDFRRAAEYVASRVNEWGLEVECHRFPARVGERFWGYPSFDEWWAEEGWLDLVEPAEQARRLADWEAVRLSLVPRSVSWEGEAELVHVPDGTRPEHYSGLDLAGKVVLTRAEDFRRAARLAHERGAVALIFYGMRDVAPAIEGSDLPDAIQYVSFWYFDDQTPRQTAFAVPPREGRRLVRLIEQAAARGEPPPRVRGRVRARLSPGEFQVVSATIPGTLPDEVLIVSHLCHPQPFANDNASGVAASLEAARVLAALRHEKRLGQPLRTLRFLWPAEMTGTFAYLQHRQQAGTLDHLLCGLNLDMVGEKQEVTGSVFLLERPGEALSGFATDLVAALRQALFAEGVSHGHRGRFALVRLAETPFSGGSDHYILSDPMVGCDTPMVIQWPDRFYHTTADTLDKVDPDSLARAATLAAAYGWWVATATSRDVHWLAHEIHGRWRHRVIAEAQAARTAALQQPEADQRRVPPAARLRYLADRQQEAVERLRRLDPEFDPVPWQLSAGQFALEELSCLDDAAGAVEWPPLEALGTAANLVPQRRVPGPIDVGTLLGQMTAEQRERWQVLTDRVEEARLLGVLVQYWSDGRRPLAEVAEMVALESGRWDPEFVCDYCTLLADLGWMNLKED